MSITIMVLDNPSLEDLYTLNLKAYTGTDVIPKPNAIEAINLIKHLPKVDVVISKEKVGPENSAHVLHEYFKTEKKNVPMIVLGANKRIEEYATVLDPSVDLKTIVKTVAKLLGVTSKEMMAQIVPDYIPLEIKYFKFINQLICDVFKQEKTDDGGYHYNKVFAQNDKLDSSAIDSFEKEGRTELFVPASYRLKFVNEYSGQLTAFLKSDNLSASERVKATEKAQEFVYKQFKGLDFSDETVELAKESIESMFKSIKEAPTLDELLANLMNNTESFQYRHCQLITFVCSHIVQNMDWGSAEQREKLSFVSFFHDIFLTSDEMVKMSSNDELEKSSLSDEDKKLVMNHAYMAADLISKHPQAPFGADTIIKEHHGVRHGIGLDPSYASNISPLAMVFLIAEEYSNEILGAHGKKKSHDEIIADMYDRFSTRPKYLSILRALEIIKKNEVK